MAVNSQVFCDLNPNLGLWGNDLLYSTDAVNSSIENILGTAPGSHWWRPNTGSYLQSLVFRPFSTTTALQINHEVTNVLAASDPRIQIMSVAVIPDYGNKTYDLTVQWQLSTSGTVGVYAATLTTGTS